MNPRVLELIKNPKNIRLEDLGLLKEEILTFPYIQNIRALHLYGVHLYEKENYQKELSITAAYTTDKKILYQLINGKIRQEPKPEMSEGEKSSQAVEKPSQYIPKVQSFPIKREEVTLEKQDEEQESTCVLPVSQEIEPVDVNGERNRILFEGEENFMDEQNSETIDIESTLESGILVTQKAKPVKEEPAQKQEEVIQAQTEEKTEENFTPETIIHEDQILQGKEDENINKEKNTSFHEVASLLPEVNTEEEVTEGTVDADNETVFISEEEQPAEELPDAEISFHGTDSFMPDVKIKLGSEEVAETTEISQPNVNKHEEEMRRLIEEVEKKMKETKPASRQEKAENETIEDREISFAETQNFHFWSAGQDEPENIKEDPVQEEVVNKLPVKETQVEVIKEKEEDVPEVQSEWKPMNVESNMPDSFISKSVEVLTPDTKTQVEKTISDAEPKTIVEETELSETVESVKEFVQDNIQPLAEAPEIKKDHSISIESSEEEEIITETLKEEVPVMNVSFFGTDISTLKVEEKQEKNKEEPVEKVQEGTMNNTTRSSADSNIPGFINTWQSWLKIDRSGEIKKEKAVIKEKAIETFIENNPRISQLKEDSSYIVKEKNDDISHLMTETLANLYFEQKLYTKAIKAFEILIRKNPDKKAYFESKIQDIKDFRSKN